MRLLQTQITPFVNNFLHIDVREQPFLYSPLHGQPSFHAHPELELVFILEGFGKRIIGNKVTYYETGDMVFIGSGVPHIWLSDPAYYKQDSTLRSKVIVTYINPKVFESMFIHIKELDGVKEMINQASKGINIFGDTRKIIAERLFALSFKTGFEKVDGLLQIMHLITVSTEKSFILPEDHVSVSGLSDRMNDVNEYITNNLSEQISLKQVADVACLTVPSFCRFFKKRTKMTFFQYLTNVRMAQACKLLIEVDKSVSYIANMCGYISDSHFCKVFKDNIGQSPYQYKCGVKQGFK